MAAQQRGQQRIGGEVGQYRCRVGVGVQQPTDAFDGGGEVTQVGELEAGRDRAGRPARRSLRQLREFDADASRAVGQGEGPAVGARFDDLQPGQGTGGEEAQQGGPVERGPDGEAQGELAGTGGGGGGRGVRAALAAPSAELARGARIDLADGVVELPHRTETGGEGDLGQGQCGGLDQAAGGLRAAGAGQGQRPGAELGEEQPMEVPGRVTEPPREARHALAFDDAVGDQSHRPSGGVCGHVPVRAAGGRVRQAAAAGPVPGRLGRCGAGVERDVARLRRPRRTARTAVDPGGGDGRVEHPVEPPVPGGDGPQARVVFGEPAGHGSIRPGHRSSS